MNYLGGKSKIAPWLAAAIAPVAAGRPFWDAFCGGLSVARVLAGRCAPGLVSDGNRALIALYQAVAAGWDPPAAVSEEEYRAARALPDTDPLKAFCGFGCSFGAKWFGGYARNAKGDNYAQRARNALLEDIPALVQAGCQLAHVDFLAVEPFEIDDVLYLDPPYLGTTGYGATGPFDHARFYERVRGWARCTDVFVSEYAMPFGRPVLEFQHNLHVTGTTGSAKAARRERLYHYAPDRPLEWARQEAA